MYIVEHKDLVSWDEQKFSLIEKDKDLKVWLKDGSIHEYDKIYKITEIYDVKQELKLIKSKEKEI
jgi:hypothetical protein